MLTPALYSVWLYAPLARLEYAPLHSSGGEWNPVDTPLSIEKWKLSNLIWRVVLVKVGWTATLGYLWNGRYAAYAYRGNGAWVNVVDGKLISRRELVGEDFNAEDWVVVVEDKKRVS